MVVIVLLVTTYLHYRKKSRQQPEEEFAAGYPAEMNLSPEKGLSPENNANAYKGLLWMKNKYEQYREQTDNKYEKLKNELARSQQKYLDLLAERVEQKTIALPTSGPAASLRSIAPAGGDFIEDHLPDNEDHLMDNEDHLPDNPAIQGESSSDESPLQPSIPDLVFEKERQIGFLHVELDQRIKNYYELEYQNREDKARAEELAVQAEELAVQYLQAQQLLEAQQGKINELNERLGHEMSKVADLTGKLENNMRLLLHIHQELDKSLHVQQPCGSSPAQNEQPPYSPSFPPAKQSHEPGRDQLPPLTENTRIAGWIESEEAGG